MVFSREAGCLNLLHTPELGFLHSRGRSPLEPLSWNSTSPSPTVYNVWLYVSLECPAADTGKKWFQSWTAQLLLHKYKACISALRSDELVNQCFGIGVGHSSATSFKNKPTPDLMNTILDSSEFQRTCGLETLKTRQRKIVAGANNWAW